MDFKAQLTKLLEKQIKQPILLEIPPSLELGDFAIHSYKLKLPPEELRAKLKLPSFIEKTEIRGPYLNFFIKKELFAKNTLQEILKKKSIYGKAKKSKQRVMIEFCQANTHKAFHIGHIRGTSIGESLARISEFQGPHVIRANYQGDTGMHVAKWMWCYLAFHKNEQFPKTNTEKWVASIYVEAVKRLASNPELEPAVEEINRQLESRNNPKLLALWKRTRALSLASFETIYKDLNTHFNHYFFEKDFEQRGKAISKELVNKGIAKIDDEAVIVNLEEYNLGVWVLLRKDGTVLYSAKDLALAEEKFKKYKIDKSIYVVGNAQKLHITQLFKTLELAGFKQAKDCFYVPVSEVRLPEGAMSSRTGENIIYSDFKHELIEYASSEIKKRHPEISEKELGTRALALSIAALKYSMLKQDLNKPIIFNKEEALNFEGDTGPYLLYSYARASSILKKAKKLKTSHNIAYPLSQQEIALIKELSNFQSITEASYTKLDPSQLAVYAFSLSKLFNEFYHACPVIDSQEQAQRLAIVQAFSLVLKSTLSLLGINVIEEM